MRLCLTGDVARDASAAGVPGAAAAGHSATAAAARICTAAASRLPAPAGMRVMLSCIPGSCALKSPIDRQLTRSECGYFDAFCRKRI